jgi:hypothetical protein
MSSRLLPLLLTLGLLACGGGGLSQQEIESKTAELVARTYDRFGSELEALERDGLLSGEPMSIAFSYHCGKKIWAQDLEATIERTTPYRAEVQWFKEPEVGWSVHGDVPVTVPTATANRELLIRMVTLGLQHRCEIRWWQPTGVKSRQLSKYWLNPPIYPVTAVEMSASAAPVALAG